MPNPTPDQPDEIMRDLESLAAWHPVVLDVETAKLLAPHPNLHVFESDADG